MCGAFGIDIGINRLLKYLNYSGPLGYLVETNGTWNADYHWRKNIFETINRIKNNKKNNIDVKTIFSIKNSDMNITDFNHSKFDMIIKDNNKTYK